jgi:hypothetical protein
MMHAFATSCLLPQKEDVRSELLEERVDAVAQSCQAEAGY